MDSDRWPCVPCDSTGLMPQWRREQFNPPKPKGTHCEHCKGHGIEHGEELEDEDE